MNVIRSFIILCATSITLACSTTPAPVIDRAPTTKTSKSAATPSSHKAGSDWRPTSYTVKKGDTLYSIGLEFGYDYKEIAQANHISAPYVIKIGQTLKFSNLNETASTNVTTAPTQESENGVVTYAINNESPQASTTPPPPATSTNSTINEPKAIREPYSDEAYKKPLPLAKSTSTVSVAPNDAVKKSNEKPLEKSQDKPQDKPADKVIADAKTEPKEAIETKPEAKTKQDTNGQLGWAWPTKGKVIANFNDAGNKGIDIAGKMGQAVHAAGAGKVIYSGSDLRGYGKLVIVKHNATFLSVYANNSLILVKEGQQVSSGQKIAEMGDTDSNTVKLHFEIRQQGKSIDPMKFLSAD